MAQTPDVVFRDHKIIGDPSSGDNEPNKAEIRALLKQIMNSSGLAVTRNTLAQLNTVNPPNDYYGGIVLNDPDDAKNGYYSRISGVWVKGRGFPDTFAELINVAGTNTVTADYAAGVDPADVTVFFIEPVNTNSGAVTLNGDPVLNVNGDALAAGEFPAGRLVMLVDRGSEWRLLSDPDADAAVAAASAFADAAAASAAAAQDALDDLTEGIVPDNGVTNVKVASDAAISSAKLSHLFPWAGVTATPLNNIFSQRIRLKAQNDFPSDATADGAAYIQTVLTWMAAGNLPLGGLLDLAGCSVRLDSVIPLGQNDVAIGGSDGEPCAVWRNHDGGPLFRIRPGTAGQIVSRSGLQNMQVYDLGGFSGTSFVTPTTDGDGYMTNCKATFANSPFGIVFDTVNQPLLRNVTGLNECISFQGIYGGTVHDVEFQIIMPYNSGRAMLSVTDSQVVGAAVPYDEASAGAWWRRINMEAGRVEGGEVFSSAAQCYVFRNCDGFSGSQFHAQSSAVANFAYVAGSGESLYNVRLIESFSDICTGRGHYWLGDGNMTQHSIHGTVNSSFASDAAEADIGVDVSGALTRSSINIDVLAGHTGGVRINHSGARNIFVGIDQAQDLSGYVVFFEDAIQCSARMGTISGYALDNATPKTDIGLIFGAGAFQCNAHGGMIFGCADYGAAFLSGANLSSVNGMDLRNNGDAYSNAGTSTSMKGCNGVTDF